MPSTGLIGPYDLDKATIDRAITKISAGVFVLGYIKKEEGSFIPKFIGRSDTDVNERLKVYTISQYTKFKYRYFNSPESAFQEECKLYHDWKKQIDNNKHPERPKGIDMKCPRCNFFK